MDMFFTLHDDCDQSFCIQEQEQQQQHHKTQHRSHNFCLYEAVNAFLVDQKRRTLSVGRTNDSNEIQRTRIGSNKTRIRCMVGFHNGFSIHNNKTRYQRCLLIQILVVTWFLTKQQTAIMALQSVRVVGQLSFQRSRAFIGGAVPTRPLQWNYYDRSSGIRHHQGLNNNKKFDTIRLQFYLQDDQYNNNETDAYLNTPLVVCNTTTSVRNESSVKSATYINCTNDDDLPGTQSDEIYKESTKESVTTEVTDDTMKKYQYPNTALIDPSITRYSNNIVTTTSSRFRDKAVLASLASLGDIMDGLSTPSLPPLSPVVVDSPSDPAKTVPPLTLEQKYGISNPLDRMVVTANGNLQRLVSSYYDSPVTVVVDSCSIRQQDGERTTTRDVTTDDTLVHVGEGGKVWDRTVRLIVHDHVFCTATSTITVYDPYCQQLVESNQIGIGQLFRYLDILPEFILHDAGYNNNNDDGGNNNSGNGASLWRLYTLQCKELSCYIREDFIPELWNIRPPEE